MPENCSAKTNNYRPCVKSHGCAAQVCCLSVASSRQRETLSAKAMLEKGLSKTVAQIEELKTDIKSLRESLKPQRAEIKQTEKEIAKLEAKKAAAEAKAAEAAKKAEAEDVLKKLLASGVTADEILEKLK